MWFKSKKRPEFAIEVLEDNNGMYYLPAAVGKVPPEQNTFSAIEDVEKVLDDELELLLEH